MLPSDNSKFNKSKGKAKYFPIKQFRFDVSQHPVIKTKDKCSYRIKTILSQQEEQMLAALSKSLNVQSKYATRIALSKVSTTSSDEVEKSIPCIVSDSKLRGHTSRDRHLAIQLTKREKEALKTIASKYKLTEKETFRLLIVHTQKGIRSGTITEFTKSKMLSQGECWDAWKKDNPTSTGKLDRLKSASSDAYKKASDEGMQRDADIYTERGYKIDQLLGEGSYIPRLDDDKIDLNYIDSCIAADNHELDEFNWELYLEELQKNDTSEREIAIEREIFLAERVGIELTEQEAIEIIEERNREPSISDEYLESIMYEWTDEINRLINIDLERELSKRLGHPISRYDFSKVLTLKKELEETLKAEKEFKEEQERKQRKLKHAKKYLRNNRKGLRELLKNIEDIKLIPDSEYKTYLAKDEDVTEWVRTNRKGAKVKQERLDYLQTLVHKYEKIIGDYLNEIEDLKK